MNLYEYVISDPLNLVDPTGTSFDCNRAGLRPGACDTNWQVADDGAPEGDLPSYQENTVLPAPDQVFVSAREAREHFASRFGPEARSDLNEAAVLGFGSGSRWYLGDIGIGTRIESTAPLTRFGVPIAELLGPQDNVFQMHSHTGFDPAGFGLFSQGDFMYWQSLMQREGLAGRFQGVFMVDRSGTYQITAEVAGTFSVVIEGVEYTRPVYRGTRQ